MRLLRLGWVWGWGACGGWGCGGGLSGGGVPVEGAPGVSGVGGVGVLGGGGVVPLVVSGRGVGGFVVGRRGRLEVRSGLGGCGGVWGCWVLVWGWLAGPVFEDRGVVLAGGVVGRLRVWVCWLGALPLRRRPRPRRLLCLRAKGWRVVGLGVLGWGWGWWCGVCVWGQGGAQWAGMAAGRLLLTSVGVFGGLLGECERGRLGGQGVVSWRVC